MSAVVKESDLSKTERLQRWDQRWEKQEIKFHKTQPNETLVDYVDKITVGRQNLTILIPLCGKSLDMMWLYQRGHTVVGIEFAQLAITSFFQEQQLQFTQQDVRGGALYQSLDERIKIFQGDLFGFDAETIGKVDAVWDRGSFVAVYQDERVRYVELIKSFLKKGFRYLLQSFEYDGETSGPSVTPRSVSHLQISSLYSDFCNIEQLQSLDKTESTKGDNIFASLIMQCDYLLTDKNSNI